MDDVYFYSHDNVVITLCSILGESSAILAKALARTEAINLLGQALGQKVRFIAMLILQ